MRFLLIRFPIANEKSLLYHILACSQFDLELNPAEEFALSRCLHIRITSSKLLNSLLINIPILRNSC